MDRRKKKSGGAAGFGDHGAKFAVPDLQDEIAQDVTMGDAPIMATPQHIVVSTPFAGPSGSSRPVTRSMARARNGSIMSGTAGMSTSLQAKLQNASSAKSKASITMSNLEDSRDITYHGKVQAVYKAGENHGGDDGEDDDGVEDGDENGDFADIEMGQAHELSAAPRKAKSALKHPRTGQLRIPTRRSARISGQALSRASTPSTALSVLPTELNRHRKKNNRRKTIKKEQPVRRSPRLAKPLEVFHKYVDLPAEIKIMVWEAVRTPRLTYICNRASTMHPIASTPTGAAPFAIQNKLPTWFMTCKLSKWVAITHYRKMFALQTTMTTPPLVDMTVHQDINPNVDIVTFEPCHSGCRGFYCARHQYSEADRAAVRFLAVQTDSPNLIPTAEPGWVSISKSWPNVETLYFMTPALRGPDSRDKAMIRMKEGDHESALRNRFVEWKKGQGKDQKVTTLEFVKVVAQEPDIKDVRERYKSVEDRATGLPEDIIMG